MKLNATVFLALTFVIATAAVAQPPERKAPISLHHAIETFNQREAMQYSETDQRPLTESELISALRRLPLTHKEQIQLPGFRELLEIAETEILPPNAYLTVLRGGYTDTHYCEVFDIQLTLLTGKKSHLTVPIRQTSISSRRIRPEERRELDAKFAGLHQNSQPE